MATQKLYLQLMVENHLFNLKSYSFWKLPVSLYEDTLN